MEEWISHFTDTVAEYIESNNITVTCFAHKIGCGQTCVSKWLNRNNTPSLEYCVKVANAMNVSLDYLFGLTAKNGYERSETKSNFRERFSALIEKSEISKNKLAKTCGVTSSTVSKWLIRNQLPKPEIAIKLAAFFGCSVDYIVGRSSVT